ncbi:MAG: 50S ribosomal protein L13 [Candidatus Aenigmarchaeota archaeon]|nr:50S ribosomal protein L13 [Candidatus Aenigmarchaeota archaeon]
MIIIDARNAVLGRMASEIAKMLKKGEDVVIVNSEQAIITGSPKQIVGKYLKRRRIGSPQHGPFFPKKPDMIVRRTVRGMMEYKKPSGRASFKRLRVHIGLPAELAGKETKSIAVKEIKTDYIKVGNLAKALGWHEKI